MNQRWATGDEIIHAARALPTGATVLTIGAADTGKSFFIRQAARYLGVNCGLKVALVDADIDQAEVCAPTVIGLLVSEAGAWPDSLRESHPTGSAFVGALSPGAAPLAWVAGAGRMVRHAARHGADRILIDTPAIGPTGLTPQMISPLLDMVHPEMIVAISRADELDPVLRLFERLNAPPLVVRMKTEPEVHRKSASVRAGRRAARFHAHFAEPATHVLALEDVTLIGTHIGTGQPQPPHVRKFVGDALGATCLHAELLPGGDVHIVLAGPARREAGAAAVQEHFRAASVTITTATTYTGLICGLIDRNRSLLDIGIISAIDFATGKLTLTTPLRHAAGIAQIVFGAIRIRPDGKLIGEVPPGTI